VEIFRISIWVTSSIFRHEQGFCLKESIQAISIFNNNILQAVFKHNSKCLKIILNNLEMKEKKCKQDSFVEIFQKVFIRLECLICGQKSQFLGSKAF
jgi:hypothetical protein